MKRKRIFLWAFVISTVIVSLLWIAWIQLRGKHTESFTFEGSAQKAAFGQEPNDIRYIEVYHDGDALVLVTIDQTGSDSMPYPAGTTVALILKDFAQFGGADFRPGRYRITMDKYVQDDNFEYWQCSAKRLPGA